MCWKYPENKSYWFVIRNGLLQKPGMNELVDCFIYCALRAEKLDTNDDIHLQQCLNYSFIQFISDNSTRLSQSGNRHFKLTWSWNRKAVNPFLRHTVRLPVRPFSYSNVFEQLFLNSHVSHVLYHHKVGHKATQNNYVLLFQLFLVIYSVKVPILPTLFSGQVKSLTKCTAMGLNSKWAFIARRCMLFFFTLWPYVLCCDM